MPIEIKFEWEFGADGKSKGITVNRDGLTRPDCDAALERLYKMIAAVKSVRGTIAKS
jgi:uncharacterized protein YjhX (UPF0386 family)